ncbi:MAG: hypothetical protein ACRYF3_15700, partial [Janthinobacterium lividum]
MSYPHGVKTSYATDSVGRTTDISATTSTGTQLLDLSYGYSAAGQLSSQTATRNDPARAPPSTTLTSGYTWDALGRLKTVTGAGAGGVSYDASGAVTGVADGRTFTYAVAGQLSASTATTTTASLTAAASSTYAYDARGNRASTTTTTTTTPAVVDLALKAPVTVSSTSSTTT